MSTIIDKYAKIIRDYSHRAYSKLEREAQGRLAHPFIVPGAAYQYELWDWDCWLTDVGIRQILRDGGVDASGFLEKERGCVLNFLEHTTEDGMMPIMIDSKDGVDFFDMSKNIHKPCLAQHLVFILRLTRGDTGWFSHLSDRLVAYIDYYKRTSYHEPTGLYFFRDDTAIGVDNDPAIFYRPEDSTASVYLNALMYKELLAMAEVFDMLGDAERARGYELDAQRLALAINDHLWDERLGMYYSADINLLPVDNGKWIHSGKPRHWHSLLLRIDSWSGFLVLWAGIAPPERAKRVIEENMLDGRTFRGRWGVRTLSRLEKMYAVWPSGNPSCWLGPLWGCSNYFCFRALDRYGYRDEARELCENTVELFGRDIEESGAMHEYYDADTGEGVNNPGFQSWNLLVNNMLAYLEGKEPIYEF